MVYDVCCMMYADLWSAMILSVSPGRVPDFQKMFEDPQHKNCMDPCQFFIGTVWILVNFVLVQLTSVEVGTGTVWTLCKFCPITVQICATVKDGAY